MPFLCVAPRPWGDTGTALVRWASDSEPGTVYFSLPRSSFLPLVLPPSLQISHEVYLAPTLAPSRLSQSRCF